MLLARDSITGRTMLSTHDTTSTPQINKPMPAVVWPVNSNHNAAVPHTSGVPKGISATSVVTAASVAGAWLTHDGYIEDRVTGENYNEDDTRARASSTP